MQNTVWPIHTPTRRGVNLDDTIRLWIFEDVLMTSALVLFPFSKDCKKALENDGLLARLRLREYKRYLTKICSVHSRPHVMETITLQTSVMTCLCGIHTCEACYQHCCQMDYTMKKSRHCKICNRFLCAGPPWTNCMHSFSCHCGTFCIGCAPTTFKQLSEKNEWWCSKECEYEAYEAYIEAQIDSYCNGPDRRGE